MSGYVRGEVFVKVIEIRAFTACHKGKYILAKLGDVGNLARGISKQPFFAGGDSG